MLLLRLLLPLLLLLQRLWALRPLLIQLLTVWLQVARLLLNLALLCLVSSLHKLEGSFSHSFSNLLSKLRQYSQLGCISSSRLCRLTTST